MKYVPPLPNKRLTKERIFSDYSSQGDEPLPNTELLKNYLFQGGLIEEDAFIAICQKSAAIMSREPNLLRVDHANSIVGDIHGQFFDMLNIMKKVGFPSMKNDKKMVFLGDYVDRGKYQTEVVAYLFCLKIRYPNNIFLLRGNHETRDCTERYDFRE